LRHFTKPKPHAKLRSAIGWAFERFQQLPFATCLGLCIAVLSSAAQACSQAPEPFPLPTQARPGAVYVGEAACAMCHVSEAGTQPSTPMGHALELPAYGAILREHSRLTFRQGPYSYEIVTKGGTSIYTVTDGRDAISEPILYAFGLGEEGQTYVVRHEGEYYESRVSFFNDTQSLDLTLGHDRSTPRTLEEALGRVMTPATTALCFGCHSTASVTAGRVHVDRLVPGVTCEACHGPGAEHVATVRQGNLGDFENLQPGQVEPR
jgi:hypothetical protein